MSLMVFSHIKMKIQHLGFVRFNEIGEVEYIFVNPIFRKQGISN